MNLGNSERLALCVNHLRRAQQEIQEAHMILSGCTRSPYVDPVFTITKVLWILLGGDRYMGGSLLDTLCQIVGAAQEAETGRKSDHPEG
jgi:hypothetical protein